MCHTHHIYLSTSRPRGHHWMTEYPDPRRTFQNECMIFLDVGRYSSFEPVVCQSHLKFDHIELPSFQKLSCLPRVSFKFSYLSFPKGIQPKLRKLVGRSLLWLGSGDGMGIVLNKACWSRNLSACRGK